MKDTNKKNIGHTKKLALDQLVQVNDEQYEIRQHGRDDYPIGIYRINVKEKHMEIVPWHWHKESEFIYIAEGCGEFLASDDSFLLYEGEALFINSEVMHSFHIAPGYDNCIFYSIVFDPEILIHPSHTLMYAKYIYPLTQDSNVRGYSLGQLIKIPNLKLSDISEIYTMNKQELFGYELYTRGFLTQIWLYILNEIKYRQESAEMISDTKASLDENRTKDAIHFIEEHYMETITLDDIAGSIHLSKSECCRCIKRCMHMSPFEYLMRFRILKSAQLLTTTHTQISIADLAQAVGINSSSYFNKLFKKYMGCTPSQYKKRMQE